MHAFPRIQPLSPHFVHLPSLSNRPRTRGNGEDMMRSECARARGESAHQRQFIRTYVLACIVPACVHACILACVSHHPCHSLALHPGCVSVLLSRVFSCGSPLTLCPYAAFHSTGVATASKDDSRCFSFRPHAVCVNAARMLS